jgi:hypothetical protein
MLLFPALMLNQVHFAFNVYANIPSYTGSSLLTVLGTKQFRVLEEKPHFKLPPVFAAKYNYVLCFKIWFNLFLSTYLIFCISDILRGLQCNIS